MHKQAVVKELWEAVEIEANPGYIVESYYNWVTGKYENYVKKPGEELTKIAEFDDYADCVDARMDWLERHTEILEENDISKLLEDEDEEEEVFNLDKIDYFVSYGVSPRYNSRFEEWLEEVPSAQPWTVCLIYNNKQYTFPFFTGGSFKPTKEEILNAVQHESHFGEMDYEEYLGEFGYEPSAKHRKTHKRMQATRKRIQRLLGDDFDAFMEHIIE